MIRIRPNPDPDQHDTDPKHCISSNIFELRPVESVMASCGVLRDSYRDNSHDFSSTSAILFSENNLDEFL